MVKEGVRKTPGLRLVQVRNQVYEFVIVDRLHPQDKEIYEMLRKIKKLLRLEGYVPYTASVLADIERKKRRPL